MLVCLLVKLDEVKLGEGLYFSFQRQILGVSNIKALFTVNVYDFIRQELKSSIFLNELILMGLRLKEFIPLLNIFLIIF